MLKRKRNAQKRREEKRRGKLEALYTIQYTVKQSREKS